MGRLLREVTKAPVRYSSATLFACAIASNATHQDNCPWPIFLLIEKFAVSRIEGAPLDMGANRAVCRRRNLGLPAPSLRPLRESSARGARYSAKRASDRNARTQ